MQKVALAWAAGTSMGAGAVVGGVGGHLAGGVFTSEHQTVLAAQCAPPIAPGRAMVGVLGLALLGVLWFTLASETPAQVTPLMALAGGIFLLALGSRVTNVARWQVGLSDWNKRWICMACATVWEDPTLPVDDDIEGITPRPARFLYALGIGGLAVAMGLFIWLNDQATRSQVGETVVPSRAAVSLGRPAELGNPAQPDGDQAPALPVPAEPPAATTPCSQPGHSESGESESSSALVYGGKSETQPEGAGESGKERNAQIAIPVNTPDPRYVQEALLPRRVEKENPALQAPSTTADSRPGPAPGEVPAAPAAQQSSGRSGSKGPQEYRGGMMTFSTSHISDR
jgi:hypothetical protein